MCEAENLDILLTLSDEVACMNQAEVGLQL